MLSAEIEKKNMDFDLKKKELATTALKNTHKNEILLKIREQLLQLEDKIDTKSFNQIKKLIKSIDDEIRLDDDWELFKRHFEDVHGDFFKRLKYLYPELTAKDLKLCAYLRINLSSKEIAPLMNISVRGVEIGRYRLRKKLNIDSDKNLFDFMLQV
jgi:DNA-binding CsgD family transcriptional regulator